MSIAKCHLLELEGQADQSHLAPHFHNIVPVNKQKWDKKMRKASLAHSFIFTKLFILVRVTEDSELTLETPNIRQEYTILHTLIFRGN